MRSSGMPFILTDKGEAILVLTACASSPTVDTMRQSATDPAKRGGWSIRFALVDAEAARRDRSPLGGTYLRASTHLTRSGLWETATARVGTTIALVRLTPLARSLLTEIGLTPVESEWERIERLHRGDTARQICHTAAICAFAYHARKRGYDTLVCPTVDGPAEPDILLTSPNENLYVTVTPPLATISLARSACLTSTA